MTLEEELEGYKALLEMAKSVGTATDLPALVEEILGHSGRVMRASSCSISLPDWSTHELMMYAPSAELGKEIRAWRLPMGAGIAGRVFQRREALNLNDVQAEADHYKGVDLRLGQQTKAMLTVPLLSGAECLGVMQVVNPRGRRFFGPKDQKVCEGIAGLIVSALERLRSQRRVLEEESARKELELAKEIQCSFLPDAKTDLAVAVVEFRMFPARVLGGDFFALHRVAGGRWLVGVGDVSGKGVPAALAMARVTAMIQVMAGELVEGMRLGEWVERLNDRLCEDMRQGRFVAVFFLLIHSEGAGLVEVCRSGLAGPFGWNRLGRCRLECPAQLALGIVAGKKYRSQEFQLEVGEEWWVFTDGVFEARNEKGEWLDEESLLVGMETGRSRSMKTVTEDWRSFAGMAAGHDDATFFKLQWRGCRPPSEYQVECCLEALDPARQFVRKWCEWAGLGEVSTTQVVLAVDEATTNILRHGYRGGGGLVVYRALKEEDCLIFEVMDQCAPWNPEVYGDLPSGEITPGGLGWVIIRKVFQRVVWTPMESGNCLRLIRFLKREEEG